MDAAATAPIQPQRFPGHGWAGLVLIAIFWPLNWLLAASLPITSIGFFPLWLGYALSVDAFAGYRTGTSLLLRSKQKYAGLFLVSAPVWWLFEVLNWRVQNWQYVGRELFSDFEYFFFASLSFSTVLPAVLGTAELIAGSQWLRRMKRGPRIVPDRRTTSIFFMLGLVMLAALLIWPQSFFPLMWISLYCLLGPLNVWLGNRSLAERTSQRDWRPVIALFGGVLVCGFFWEFWNFYSYPKWIYTIPWADFARLFEMPALGYGGYLPFSLELFAVYHLAMGLLGDAQTRYISAGLFPNEREAALA
jgi:hypothetical protein